MRLVVGAAVIAIACGASAQGQTLQEQDLCAKQAQKAFELWQGDSANLNLPKSIDTYQSHYSLSLKKCFIRIQSAMSFAGISESALLIDAYEQRVYAFYSEHISFFTNGGCEGLALYSV